MSAIAPLDQQIIAALTLATSSEAASKVLVAAEERLRELSVEADNLDNESLSPLLTKSDADQKRQEAADLRFESDRMDASVSALRVRISKLQDAERVASYEASRDAARDERDQLIKDIRKQYPIAVRIITDLVKRINEAELGTEAEAVAREVPGSFSSMQGGSTFRLHTLNLPMPTGFQMAWEEPLMHVGFLYHGLEAK